MHKHDKPGTRITVERISVTTIRTQSRAAKVYCDICGQAIAQKKELTGPLLLNSETDPATDVDLIKTDIKGEKTK